jgi:NitT/TauT family transport system permease protein
MGRSAGLALEKLVVGGTTLFAVLIVWQAAVSLHLIDPIFVSSPVGILIAGRELFGDPDFWRDVRVSATEFATGYLAAIALAVPIGLATGWFKRAHYVLGPFIDALNAVPRVTFLPIIVIWFGIGLVSKFVVVFLGALIPIIISTHAGVRASEARFVRVARSFGASQRKILASIVLPGTVPFIFTGLKYAAGRALLGVVVGELYASTAGIGHMIAEAGNTFQTDVLFVGVLLFTATGLLTTAVLDRIEKRFERWRPPPRASR